MSDFLKPKAKTGDLSKRRMENGIFRNPPSYTQLGGFTSEGKFTDPSGKRYSTGGMSLEKGGPTSQRGKPI